LFAPAAILRRATHMVPRNMPFPEMVTHDSDSEFERFVERRKVLNRMLQTLIDARSVAPGAPVSYELLAARVWPGAMILRHAAKNRIRVAIATLRKHGLGATIRTHRGGYSLVP